MAEAQRAVRALESQITIENIVIGDQRVRRWRRRDPKRDRDLDRPDSAQFAVSMSGTAQNIEQARALLRANTVR